MLFMQSVTVIPGSISTLIATWAVTDTADSHPLAQSSAQPATAINQSPANPKQVGEFIMDLRQHRVFVST
jgi:hypothetical protein